MTTLTTAPATISFSKNPLPVVITSDEADYLAAAAAIAVNFLQFTAAVAEDDVFVLAWANGSATMTAKDAPDESGLQFPSGAGDEAYVIGLLPWFRGNYFLDRDFVVSTDFSGDHPRLIFTAKLPGPEYNITTENGGASGNTVPGVTNEPVENFAHHTEAWITAGGNAAVQAYSANVALDGLNTGASSLELQNELHAFLTADFPVLDGFYAQCLNSIGSAFLKYAAYKGSDPSIRRVYTSDTFYVNRGGLGMQPARIRNLVTELCPAAGDATQNRFLRQGSKNKLVDKGQPEWLTFLNLSGAAVTVALEVVIYNDDESSATFESVSDLEIAAYGKFQFVAGYTQLAIGGRQAIDKNPVYYTVRVKSADGYLTDTYAFVIDNRYREWPRYVVYENSYGAYQTIATVGKLSPELDRSKTDAQLAVSQSVAATTGELIETDIFIQGKGTLSIGYDRADQRTTALLQDFLVSENIFLYRQLSSGDVILIPIGLDTKNFKFPADGTNVFAGAIEYFYKYRESNWTEDLPIDDDDLAQLIADAGSPIPNSVPPELTEGGVIVVEHGDYHLSVSDGLQRYTAPFWLTARSNYRIWSTQLGRYFFTEEIAYNPAGSFTILVPGFLLQEGDQLIINPFVLNPDSI
ncbi:MAG TPA: hypothetical protein VHA56_16090 [Mucilaginibacter sp.]|nr:hypothetical protein [Mucilaginibacter sp.]